MAEGSISEAQGHFSCPICLDLLKDPVTIPCGHSYCMNCITDCWNQDDQKGVYSCPQCRQTFTPRPALNKNVVFAEMVEKLKKAKVQTAHPALNYAGPGDVECDVCSGRKYKAIKSCLLCLESYCQTHFECHEAFRTGKRHKITDATGRLQEMICPLHDKLMEVYCRTDQKCICLLCTMDEHKNHDTVSSTSERTEKQKQLEDTQRNFQQTIQEREKELQNLKEAVETNKRSAQEAVEDSEKMFTELIRSIERRRSEVIQMIRDQEKAEVSRVEGLMKQLEQEIDALRRRDAELEQLLHTDNHIHLLQRFQSLSEPLNYTDISTVAVSSALRYEDVGKCVSELKEKLEDFFSTKTQTVYSNVVSLSIGTYQKEPKTRKDFLLYFLQLSLDQNTAHKCLCLSEENRVATNTKTVQPYPDHPDRFDNFYEVLCKERVKGRCYWEVEWSANESENGVPPASQAPGKDVGEMVMDRKGGWCVGPAQSVQASDRTKQETRSGGAAALPSWSLLGSLWLILCTAPDDLASLARTARCLSPPSWMQVSPPSHHLPPHSAGILSFYSTF
ncbi:E3 ubiquitin-protein ligase TRIM16-like [Labeo rohita]|uniref:E3 ubiquitin-protein ligase TRIM16-like n=1 Tax=Labeo rohita TaxID=84645 RepID=UPI0021E1C371|nr:E3 ubiquitin-protein ligase TRIM16-like [Labeo rohita]